MASPAKIAQVLPDTLPEDFGDWDSAGSPAAPPARSGGSDPAPVFIPVSKPPAQPVRQGGPQASVARKAGVLSNAASAIRPNRAVADGVRNPASLKAEAMRDADEILFQSIRTNRAGMGKQSRPSKKQIMVATIPAGLILVIFAFGTLFYHGKLPMFRHAVEAQPVAADTQPANSTIEPPMQLPSAQQSAKNAKPQAAVPQPATDQKVVTPPQLQSKMMQDQLNAPTRIPHDVKLKASDDASSLNIGAANIGGQGNGSAIGNIFNGQSQSNVTVASPKTVSVSAGVAGGLLVQRTAPVYPQIAKTARVTGTVVLKATISKTGVIENLRVVSGPGMLTQAAVDAVRTWRYKPYKLNNEPVEIETTVNVVFSLAG